MVHHATLCHAMLYCAVPCSAVPWCTMLCLVLCQAAPYHVPCPCPPPLQVRVTAEEVSPLHLTNVAGTGTMITGSRFAAPRELVFSDFYTLPRDVYFWVLPTSFTGDKVLWWGRGMGDGRVSMNPAEPRPHAGDIVRGRAAVHGDAPRASRCPATAAAA